MPNDSTSPSQNWNVQDQINASGQIIKDRNKKLQDYNDKTNAISSIDSILTNYENQGIDTSSFRKQLDEKTKDMGIGFGEKLGVVGRNIGTDYVKGFNAITGQDAPELSFSQKVDEAKLNREKVINPLGTIATDVMLDPATYTPINFASKGTKLVRAGKDFLKGGAVAGGTYTARNAGEENYSPTDSLVATLFGGTINAGIGGAVNRSLEKNALSPEVKDWFGKSSTNPDSTSGENITMRILSEGGNPFVKDAKLQDLIDRAKGKTNQGVQQTAQTTNNYADSQNTPMSADDIASKIISRNFPEQQAQQVVEQPKVEVPTQPVQNNTAQDIFGFKRDAQQNAEAQAKADHFANINAEKKNYDPYIFPESTQKTSKLPDVLPLDNREEMKNIVAWAMKNDATDELLSKLPESANKDNIALTFQKMKPVQQEQDGIVPVTFNRKEPIKNYDIPSLQEFEGLTKASGQNTADVLSLSTPTNTQGVRSAIDRYINGTATSRDFEILDSVENFMKYEGDNFRAKVGATKPDTSIKIDDAVRNNIDYKTADSLGAIPFANGGKTLGGAFVGGSDAEFNQRDYNNDGIHDAKDNLIGALIGVVGVHGARKIFPKAFKDPNIDKNTAGMFVGKDPTDTIRVENQGKYKIPLSQDVQDLSKIKANELNFKEFNNPNAKHKEQNITNSAELKRVIDKALGKPTVFSDGTSHNTRLISSNINNKDNIVVADKQSGNVVSSFATSKPNYISKVIEKDSGVPPTTLSSQQGTTVSSKDAHNTVLNLDNKSISNNIPKSQDIKLNASPTLSGGMVGGIVGVNNDLNGDGKIDFKDIAIGALGGAGLTKGALMMKNSNIATKAKDIIKNISDTDTADKILGHHIYEKTDYMNIREDMITSKTKQVEKLVDLHNELKLLDDQTRKDIYDYMNGKAVNLNGNIKTLADNYTNEINRLGEDLVNLGVLEQGQFDKFKDRYLHRVYAKDFTQQFNSLFSKGKTIQGVHARGNEWTGTKDEFEKLLANGEIGDFFDGKIEATRMNNGQYKFRQDWTEEQRTRWGEIKDIAFSLPETLMRLKEMGDHANMLKRIVDETGYVSNDALDGYVQLTGKRYGALNGKYVPADIASDIKEFGDSLFGSEGKLLGSKAMEAYKMLSTFWKKSHTVYNPIAHLNNLLSNVTMQFGAGINPNKAIMNAYRGASASQKVDQFRELTAKKIIGLTPEETVTLRELSQDEDLKLWNQAREAGLFGRSNLNDILNKYVNPTTTQTNNGKFRGLLSKVDKTTENWYQGEDNIMRFSMLKSLVDDGMPFENAIKEVNNNIPDYTKPMSQWARFGRNSMLTPFISWTYYATPIILRQMKERPERILALYGALYGMNQMWGIDPFNEKDIPQQNFSMKRIPIWRNGNEVTTVKVDRWIPHNDVLSPLDFIKNLTTGGAWSPLKDIPRNQDSYFGGKITNKEGALKAYHLAKYGIQQITPDVLDNAYNFAESKIMSPEKRSNNPVVQPRTSTQELLKFIGINSMTYNKSNQAQKVAREKGN